MIIDQFQEILGKQLSLSKVVPITVNPKNILKSLLVQEDQLTQEEEYQYVIRKQELIIKRMNDDNADVILTICNIIKQEMSTKLDLSREQINENVQQQIVEQQQIWPQFKLQRWPEYFEYFTKLAKILLNITYQLIEQILIDLTTKPQKCEEFHSYMTDKLEQTMCLLSMEMSDFVRVEGSNELYWGLKKYYNSIIQNIHLFINRTSLLANTQMEFLNQTLTTYHTLANIRTYQVLQTETSQLIIQTSHNILQEMIFNRVEFHIFDKDLVKQVIRHFYEYQSLNLGAYKISTLTQSFQESLQMHYILDDLQLLQAELDSQLFDQNEDCIKYKSWLYARKQIQSQQMLTGGSLVGGSIGAGLGCLIVDSVDAKIPWDEKLKRAGFSSVATGVVGAAMRIPVVGVILSQALLIYAIKVTAGNKVVDKNEKMKNMAHLGVQSSVGIGSAVAGQILIPIPVLGAIIGGTVGGVAMSLYSKFLVPKTKPKIKIMINTLMDRQLEDGMFTYDETVIKVMSINKQHFFGLKPDNLTDSQWLTVIIIYMVNEVHYLTNIQGLEKIKELQEQLEKKPQNEPKIIKEIKEIENDLEQQEIISVKLERSRVYIEDEQINTLKIAEKIGEFINGMIQNFRI